MSLAHPKVHSRPALPIDQMQATTMRPIRLAGLFSSRPRMPTSNIIKVQMAVTPITMFRLPNRSVVNTRVRIMTILMAADIKTKSRPLVVSEDFHGRSLSYVALRTRLTNDSGDLKRIGESALLEEHFCPTSESASSRKRRRRTKLPTGRICVEER